VRFSPVYVVEAAGRAVASRSATVATTSVVSGPAASVSTNLLWLVGSRDEPEGGLDHTKSFGGVEVVTGPAKPVLEVGNLLLEEFAPTVGKGHEFLRLFPSCRVG
jgi:hypothetical protein